MVPQSPVDGSGHLQQLTTRQRILLGWWVATTGPVWSLAWTVGAVSSLARVASPDQTTVWEQATELPQSAAAGSVHTAGGDSGTGGGGGEGEVSMESMLSSPRGGARVAGALERMGLQRWAFLPATIIANGLNGWSFQVGG